ncbi:hypothetical protein K504DRAFT_495370 [Pleomassaria siparia CBS 279.74]|uniref:Uncharacterized protein n=1 Tax=Pleomassaria siparia CBS 279.74 TaxID=1314801 RepID=A0A6G1JTM5_9PLEO|nr:hypothetical protein K504DRAFT_495370 [Pleomassaria siparia CBS 279.74]
MLCAPRHPRPLVPTATLFYHSQSVKEYWFPASAKPNTHQNNSVPKDSSLNSQSTNHQPPPPRRTYFFIPQPIPVTNNVTIDSKHAWEISEFRPPIYEEVMLAERQVRPNLKTHINCMKPVPCSLPAICSISKKERAVAMQAFVRNVTLDLGFKTEFLHEFLTRYGLTLGQGFEAVRRLDITCMPPSNSNDKKSDKNNKNTLKESKIHSSMLNPCTGLHTVKFIICLPFYNPNQISLGNLKQFIECEKMLENKALRELTFSFPSSRRGQETGVMLFAQWLCDEFMKKNRQHTGTCARGLDYGTAAMAQYTTWKETLDFDADQNSLAATIARPATCFHCLLLDELWPTSSDKTTTPQNVPPCFGVKNLVSSVPEPKTKPRSEFLHLPLEIREIIYEETLRAGGYLDKAVNLHVERGNLMRVAPPVCFLSRAERVIATLVYIRSITFDVRHRDASVQLWHGFTKEPINNPSGSLRHVQYPWSFDYLSKKSRLFVDLFLVRNCPTIRTVTFYVYLHQRRMKGHHSTPSEDFLDLLGGKNLKEIKFNVAKGSLTDTRDQDADPLLILGQIAEGTKSSFVVLNNQVVDISLVVADW